MNYRKINLLHIARYLVLGIVIVAWYCFSTSLSDMYQTELGKNQKQEEILFANNPLGRIELQLKYMDKRETFNHYIDYLFFSIIIGISITAFVNRKIATENKRLDYLEGKQNQQDVNPNSWKI